MRYIVLIISFLFLFNIVSCNKHKDEIVYLYGVYDMKGKYFGIQDTLTMHSLNDTTNIVTIIKNGTRKQIKVVQTANGVNLFVQGKESILYNLQNDSIYENPEFSKETFFPYFVNNSKFLIKKLFKINNKNYLVSLFRTNNHSTINDFVYYSSDFGFVAYTKGKNSYYKKLDDIINLPSNRREIALKLANEIMKDSLFSLYPKIQQPVPMKFSIPK